MSFEEIEEAAKKRELVNFKFFVKHIAIEVQEEKQREEYISYIERSIENYEYHTKKTSVK